MSIQVRNLTKTFGAFAALDDVNLEIRPGELVALLGPSGSGKTTLLRILAGLETPDRGDVIFGSQDATNRRAGEREIGFVFQHYALFRHMTVFENIAFGLRVRPRATRPSNAEIRARVEDLLRLVQLEGLAKRFPSQLSGGQRQRVALARALAVEPKTLLLDEPFGALDARVRQDLRLRLRRLHDDLGLTSVFVTHDQEEALELADRVVVMNKGRIEQIGTPTEVYDHPANPFVFHFLGRVNLFHGRVQNGRAELGSLAIDTPEHQGAPDAPAVAYVRPHDLEIVRQRNGTPTVEAVVRHIHPVGPTVRLDLERTDSPVPLSAELTRERFAELGLSVGESVHVAPRRAKVFTDVAGTDDYSI